MLVWPLKFVEIPLKEFKKILYYHVIFEEYKKLKRESDTLSARLVGLEEVIKDNTRLERLLEFKRKLIFPSVAAYVIGRDPSRWNSIIIIDKGRQDGLVPGMAVVSPEGIVGKIIEADKKISKIILITDPQFSVAALVQPAHINGIISGSLQGFCRMRYLNESQDIKAGDKVVTSKLSSSFPEGLLVGEVMKIEVDIQTNEINCLVKPAVKLSQLDEVLVIR